ncbi:ABC transporter permease [Exiguobacterium indicum]|uniref:ABC transporter permease n=1 Tax=Exiguobacterium indicum TaxID=296995 RepID=UPI003314894F
MKRQHLFRLSHRLYRKSPMILVTSIGSVMISIGLVLTMVIFLLHNQAAIETDRIQRYGQVDLTVKYTPEDEQADQSVLEQLKKNHDVLGAESILQTTARVAGQTMADVETIGVHSDALTKSRYHFTNELEQGEAILSARLATSLDRSVGQTLRVGEATYRIREILPNTKTSEASHDQVLLSYADLKKNHPIETKAVLLNLKKEADLVHYADTLVKANPKLRIELSEGQALSPALNGYIGILSVLILVVSGFILMANFDLYLRKHAVQFAIMRTLGATTRQLFQLFFVQSGLIVLAGTMLTILGSICLPLLGQLVWPTEGKMIVSLMIDQGAFLMLVTFGSALLILLLLASTAYRKRDVLPLHVLRENLKTASRPTRRKRLVLFSSGLTVSLVLFAEVIASTGGSRAIAWLVATVAFLLTMYLATPLLLKGVLQRAEPIVRRLAGPTSFVAFRGVLPQLRKNAWLMLIVQVLMIIVVIGSTFLETVQQNERKYIISQYPTEVVLKSRLDEGSQGNPLQLIRQIETDLPGARATFLSSRNSFEYQSPQEDISIEYEVTDYRRLDVLAGEQTSDTEGIIVSRTFAKTHSLQKGDMLPLGRWDGEQERSVSVGQFRIVGIEKKIAPDVLVDWRNEQLRQPNDQILNVFIDVPSELTKAQVTTTLLEITESYPTLQVNRLSDALRDAEQQTMERWFVFLIALVVMSGSVWFGLANALLSFVSGKRGEYALLRTIALTRNKLRQLTLIQMLLFIGSGITFGLISGLGATFFVTRIDDTGSFYFNVPTIAGTIVGLIVLVISIAWFVTRRKQENLVHELKQ